MTHKELRDIAMNFIIAGKDTTAQLLSWFTYAITTYKNGNDVVTNILNEFDNINKDQEHNTDNNNNNNNNNNNHPDDNNNINSDYATISKLNYLQNCLLETLRLYPSVPHLARFIKSDIHIQINDKEEVFLHKGDGIVIPLYAMGRMPWIWDNPLEFNPLRFESKKFTPSEYPAFNIPPRLCLGKHVSLLEAKIAIIKLLKKYTIVKLENQNMEWPVSPTNLMKNGLKVKLIPK